MFRKFLISFALVTFGISFVASVLSQIDGNYPLACFFYFCSVPNLWSVLILLDNK